MGARLLERTTRRVALTEDGRALYADLGPLLARLDDTLRAVGGRALLRLGFTSAARPPRRPHRRRGRLVRRDAPLAGLETGACDVAVVRGEAPPGDDVRARVLPHEARVAAVARTASGAAWERGARRRVLDWAGLARFPLVVITVSGTTRPELWPGHHRPQLACTADNFDEWLEAIAAGHGIGVVSEAAARRHSHPGIRFPRLRNAPPVTVRPAIPARGPHPLAERFFTLAAS